MRLLAITVVAAALSLAGCAGSGGGRLGETGQVQVLADSPLPEPTGTDIVATERSYVIGPQDQLSIDVFGIEQRDPILEIGPLLLELRDLRLALVQQREVLPPGEHAVRPGERQSAENQQVTKRTELPELLVSCRMVSGGAIHGRTES